MKCSFKLRNRFVLFFDLFNHLVVYVLLFRCAKMSTICVSSSFVVFTLSLSVARLCLNHTTSLSGLSVLAFAIASTIFVTSLVADAPWPPLTRFFLHRSSILIALNLTHFTEIQTFLCSTLARKCPTNPARTGSLCCRTYQDLRRTGSLTIQQSGDCILSMI